MKNSVVIGFKLPIKPPSVHNNKRELPNQIDFHMLMMIILYLQFFLFLNKFVIPFVIIYLFSIEYGFYFQKSRYHTQTDRALCTYLHSFNFDSCLFNYKKKVNTEIKFKHPEINRDFILFFFQIFFLEIKPDFSIKNQDVC